MIIAETGICAVVNVEIVLVPFDDLVIRTILFPAFDAFFRQLRFRISAEPAVMDLLRNGHDR